MRKLLSATRRFFGQLLLFTARSTALSIVLSIVVVAAILTVPTVSASAQTAQADNPTLVVNSTDDRPDSAGSDGVCADSQGECTLRAAIQQANYNAGSDRIEFNIAGSGTKQISIGSGLPSVNDPTGGLTIDGYTQSDASPNTQTHGSNANIRVEIMGSGDMTMMLIESAENTVRGLAIFGGKYPIELRGEGADGNNIVGNFIGTNASATSNQTGHTGLQLNLGPDLNRIGTPDLADRNVISGLGGFGIRINHGETSQNRVQNNVVGLSPDGSDDMGGSIGIDIQWWTWGNLIGGTGPGEHNVVSANDSGIDLSHKATGNIVLGNYIGTTLDGTSANSSSRNGRGIVIKDDAKNNYFAENIIAGAGNDYAIWHKHNYSGANTFVDNRIGVSIDGSDIGSAKRGMLLRGHDDVYYGNTMANVGGTQNILISNTSVRDEHTPEPDEQTVRNAIRRGTYYGNSDPKPIEFGSLCCPHPNEDTPEIVGMGPGQVNGNGTCAGCEVEVYLSGSLNGDGTLAPGTGTTGLTWIGTVLADSSGNWSMASSTITAGSKVRVSSITPSGEASDFSDETTIPSSGSGLISNPDQPTTPAPPATPILPPLYQPEAFDCSFESGVLSWTDVGADAYYVFATINGAENYLGGHSTTSLDALNADSYRVEHWSRGIATNALCDGPGTVSNFTCSHDAGVLSWTDAGAGAYYVFATTNGNESYLGGHSTTDLTVAGADSYRVEHWITGQATNAICDGPGPGQSGQFDCAFSNGVLSWDDAGADAYYVFATISAGGGETYLGGHSATGLNVPDADSYRVEHWITGQATNALCDGEGTSFDCSVSNGTLSWDDAGAPAYYVFAYNGGNESYLGGHSATSLAVNPAEEYRVEHWITGQATNALCGP